MVNDYLNEANLWYARANSELRQASEEENTTGPRESLYRYTRARAFCEMGAFSIKMAELYPNEKPDIITANDIDVPRPVAPAPEPVAPRKMGPRPRSAFEKTKEAKLQAEADMAEAGLA